jgi:curved DNA-binding protein CbpA
MDYYAILGIARDAEDIVVGAAYRAMVKKYHPDVFRGPKARANAKIREINEAYETLSDPKKRSEYDKATEMRARPSAVLGPVLAPPWSLQRPLFLLAGRRHAVPRRVFAPHRCPGQSVPNRHSIPMVTLSLISIRNTPNIGCYYTAN